MKQDYNTESQRAAYVKGIYSRIAGHDIEDNPHKPIEGLGYSLEYFAWRNGYNETGMIKEMPK